MLWVLLSGCGRKAERHESALSLPIDVLADTGRTQTLHVVPPRVWITRVGSSRGEIPPVEPASGRELEAPLPTPEPGTLPPVTEEPALTLEGNLVPPTLRSANPLRVPRGVHGESVELEVRVDESGAVGDVQWAGGSRDSALVRAAAECAAAMRFFPATRGGRPVVVWCRQRFDFGSRPSDERAK
jgi:TonB family protein